MNDHLSSCVRANSEKYGLKYKQRLIESLICTAFWQALPKTVRVVTHGRYQLLSVDQL